MLRTPKARAFWPVLVGLLFADVVTKWWAESMLVLHLPYLVFGGSVVRFTLNYNTGAAMDLSVGAWSRVVFSVLTVVALVVVARSYRALPDSARLMALTLALIGGGALGNLLDRLRSDRGVVDFIDIGVTGWRFWTFNVADMGVSCGAVLLGIMLWREDRTSKQE